MHNQENIRRPGTNGRGNSPKSKSKKGGSRGSPRRKGLNPTRVLSRVEPVSVLRRQFLSGEIGSIISPQQKKGKGKERGGELHVAKTNWGKRW